MNGEPNIPPQVRRGFVKFLNAERRPVGCGFLISRKHICTCAHVINAALHRVLTTTEPPDDQILLVFPFLPESPKAWAKIKPDCWRPLLSIGVTTGQRVQDIAVLEIEDTPPQCAPLPTSAATNLWEHPFGAYGYPAEKPDGAWATGKLLDLDDAGLIQIEDSKETGYFVQPGFSGTPVWDKQLGCVVGMVTLAEPEPRKRVAFVIPIAIAPVMQICPEAFAPSASPFERLTAIPPGCPAGYRMNIQDFFRLYLGTEKEPKPFGGRDKQLAFLNGWLKDQNKPERLLVVAPAGRGKSTLLVHWAARLSEEWRLIFIPISIRKRTNRPETFFQALAAHLAVAVGQSLPPAPADAAQFYHDKTREYLDEYDRNQDKPLLIILDGLDEAAGFESYEGLFPKSRMTNVKLVVSARLIARAPNAESWLERLDWESPSGLADFLEVPRLDREGLEDVLRKMGCPLSDLARDVDIVSRLLLLTEGDPLLVGLYVDDLWGRGDSAARLTPGDLDHITPGFGGYFRRWFDDQQQLWGTTSPLREQETLGVLAILACALGPLRASEIVQLMSIIYSKDVCGIPQLIKPLERFVIGNPDSDGYVLSHPKLSEFLSSADNRIVDGAIVSRTKQGFLDWGSNTLTRLAQGEMEAEQTPEYLLLYYARHLAREHAPAADFMALVEDGWRRAWYAYEGGYNGFANDVAAASEVLKQVAGHARSAIIIKRFLSLPTGFDACSAWHQFVASAQICRQSFSNSPLSAAF